MEVIGAYVGGLKCARTYYALSYKSFTPL